jgi:hypothetical protein
MRRAQGVVVERSARGARHRRREPREERRRHVERHCGAARPRRALARHCSRVYTCAGEPGRVAPEISPAAVAGHSTRLVQL